MRFTTDEQTLEDLNIFGKRGGESVYALFNHCATRGGAAILEEMFRYPLSDEEAINKRSGIIQYFASAGAVFPFQSELFDVAELYLSDTDERTKLSADERTLEDRLTNAIGADSAYKTIYKGVTALLEILHGLRGFVGAGGATGAGPMGAGPMGAGSMGAGVTGGAEARRIAPEAYRADSEAIARLLADAALEPLFSTSVKGKLPYGKVAEFDIQLRFRHRGTIRKLLRHIYQLDVYVAVAKVAHKRGFAFPRALPPSAHTLRLEGLYHPQLKNPVSNTLHITPDSNVLFLTGANMAGKSTFMKSLSIALFLGHMGLPVPASKMEFSVLDGIYTTINLPDNLGMGASHFYAEVLRVKKIAQELSQSKNLFIVFDELFRGTNVKDAYEATIAITSAFAVKRNSIFVISTHIIEAGEVLKERCDNIRFVYLPTRMKGNTPVYTYTLETGITDDRHGMIIINNEGILEILRRGRALKGRNAKSENVMNENARNGKPKTI
jgi:DNA mismatch repair protein MutS